MKPIVIIGSGFSGLASAFHIAEAGLPVVILERKESLGGYFPELKRQFPTNSCGVCFMHPEYPAYCPYIEAERHENIKSYTSVKIENIKYNDDEITISFKIPNGDLTIEASTLIIATGYEPFDVSKKPELGGGIYDNVFSAFQFENRLYDFMAEGKAIPYKKIAYVQCVGSRDLTIGRPYCSSFCCMYALKQALLIKECSPETEVTIYYMDMRVFGKDYERYLRKAIEMGVKLVRSAVATVRKRPSTGKLELLYTENSMAKEEVFDTVILSQGASINSELLSMLERLNINLDLSSQKPIPDRKIAKNIFVTGTLFEPMDILDSVIDGIATAYYVISEHAVIPKFIEPLKIKYHKPQKLSVISFNLSEEDDGKLREFYPETLKINDADEMAKAVKDLSLDSCVIVTDDIRKTEALFKWQNYFGIHINSVFFVSSKSLNLYDEVSSLIHRLKQVQRSGYHYKVLNDRVCIIGGGLAGLVSANNIARLGLKVLLIEKSDNLGGRLLYIPSRKELISEYISAVKNNPNVEILNGFTVKDVEGRKGDFNIVIESASERRTIKAGAIVIATGATPRRGVLKEEDNAKIFSFHSFEDRLEELVTAKDIAFLQCAGSRNDENPVCYRVCCTKAVEQALTLKEKNNNVNVWIFHRDIRTYGYNENLYRQARKAGIYFVRVEKEPEIVKKGDRVQLLAVEEGTKAIFDVDVDYLLLSTGVDAQTKEIAQILNLETLDGFLQPYNKKTGILDLKNGIYGAGLCMAPNYTPEVIKQAQAISVRVALKLLKKELVTGFNIAFVNPKYCCGCELCIKACPVSARYLDEEEKIARVDETLCEGCGTCAMVCANKASQHKVFEHKSMLKTIDIFMR